MLLEDAIRQPDLAKTVQRYQLAVDKAKVHLDLVAAPGVWLMPLYMVINTEKTVAYNNKLRQATPGMKLGINNDMDTDTKTVTLHLMDGGLSKINPPNSDPSNSIHKAAQGLGEQKKEPLSPTTPNPARAVTSLWELFF